MKKIIILSFILSFSAVSFVSAQIIKEIPNPASVGTTSEIHVTSDSKVVLQGAYVQQVAGSNFYTRIYWGDSYFKLTIRTNKDTKITRKFGGSANISEIQPGDFLTVNGTILAGSDSFNVIATSMKDWSLQDEKAKFKGKITSVGNPNPDSFSMILSDGSSITVHVAGSGMVTKGALNLYVGQLKAGDVVSSATGNYNYPTNTLEATSVVIYQDQSIFWAKNFQGKLKSLSGTTLPTQAVITIDDKDYDVYLSSDSSVLNTAKNATSLARFVIGDTVRIYGNIRKTNLSIIDATVIRNISL